MARRPRKQPTSVKNNYAQLSHILAPQSIISDDHIEQIHANALTILQDLGIKILFDEARDLLQKAGAHVVEEMVFFHVT